MKTGDIFSVLTFGMFVLAWQTGDLTIISHPKLSHKRNIYFIYGWSMGIFNNLC